MIAQAIKKYEIPRHKLVLMTKAYSCVGEQQFHAYPILDELRRTKDYVNQFGKQREEGRTGASLQFYRNRL